MSTLPIPDEPSQCPLNTYWVGNRQYCAPCSRLLPALTAAQGGGIGGGGFAAQGAGNCSYCNDPHASATALDDGRGTSCACPFGWGQRIAVPTRAPYGQPTPAPVPVCDKCLAFNGPTQPNVNGETQPCSACAAGWFMTAPLYGTNGVACAICPIGFYSSPSTGGCKACPAGTTTLVAGGATKASECVACPAGVSWSAGKGGPCLPCVAQACDRGMRVQGCSPSAQAACVPCDAGTVQTDRHQPASVVTTRCPACYNQCASAS